MKMEICDLKVREIDVLYSKGLDCHDIAVKLGMTTSQVSHILTTKIRLGKLDKETALKLFKEGSSMMQIANLQNIMYSDVFNFINQLRKKDYTYLESKLNKKEGHKKHQLDKEFVKFLKPTSILDAYAGNSKVYDSSITISNDINKEVKTQFHLPADKFLYEMSQQKSSFDLVDLDPFGCCHDCWEMSIRLAGKGIIISYGEVPIWRYKCKDTFYWKKILGDYSKYATNIHGLKYALISQTIAIGEKYHKLLIPWHISMPHWFWMRVYYAVKEM